MAKKNNTIKELSQDELHKFVQTKREELRGLRFSATGSKTHNVKHARTLRREIARALTETSARKNVAN